MYENNMQNRSRYLFQDNKVIAAVYYRQKYSTEWMAGLKMVTQYKGAVLGLVLNRVLFTATVLIGERSKDMFQVSQFGSKQQVSVFLAGLKMVWMQGAMEWKDLLPSYKVTIQHFIV